MCAFIPKYHLLTLARLMHLGVACAGRVLGRRRRMEDGRVHNRARADADAAILQIVVDRLQHGSAQIVLLQQMTEVQNRRLVRRCRTTQIDARKPPQRRRIVQPFFGARIRQVEPVLQKVNPQQDAQPHRRTTVARLGVMRLYQRLQLRPRHDPVHLFQKRLSPGLLPISLEASLRSQSKLPHPWSAPCFHITRTECGLGSSSEVP